MVKRKLLPSSPSPKVRKIQRTVDEESRNGKHIHEGLDVVPVVSEELHFDVLTLIASKIGHNPGLLRLSGVNWKCRRAVEQTIRTYRSGLTVDVADFNQTKVLLHPQWYESGIRDHIKQFHNAVRETISLLVTLSEYFRTDENALLNLSPQNLGWFFPNMEVEIRRCPPLLQKKMVALFRQKFNKTTDISYHASFLRPSRFIALFKHRLETITKLDLGDMKPLKKVGLRYKVFPNLTNLRELVWHSAEMWFVKALPFPQKLERLCMTLSLKGIHGDVLNVLTNCQDLKELHTGVHRPPMNRFVWTVALRSYQAFWNLKQYVPENLFHEKGIVPVPLKKSGARADHTYYAFPKLEKISFWDAPEYLFTTMAKEAIYYKEMKLGLLTQGLQSLCSLDSIMQAFFKYMAPDTIHPLLIDHLKLNTHSMPVVHLDYYLPNLMEALGKCLPSLKTLDLFVHCLIAGASMPSSWSLAKQRPKRPKPKFENLTRFSFHIDGYCILDELDTYLPDTIQSISLSFVLPADNRRQFLTSLLRFLEFLGDINRFPDLDELHIQVYGLSCFEPVCNAVLDHIPSLKRLSVVTLPVNPNTETVMNLIGQVVEKCPHLVEFGLSSEMINSLMGGETTKEHWRHALFDLGERCGIQSNCTLTVKKLPETSGWDQYVVQPIPSWEEVNHGDSEEEEQESKVDSVMEDDDAEDEEEDDSFVVTSDSEHDMDSDDTLDEAEKVLEKEDERSHKRWMKRRARIVSESSEKSDGDEDDVIVFRKRRPGRVISSEEEDEDEEEEEERNPFADDEADEVSEESEEDETEPEGEDLVQSDDEELFEAQAQLIDARPRRYEALRKNRRIIESDSE